MTKKVLITNIVSLNPGDAAILLGMKLLIVEKYGPDTEIIVYDRNASSAEKYYDWCDFKQSLFLNKSTFWVSKFLRDKGYTHWVERLDYYRKVTAFLLLKKRLKIFARLLVSKKTLLRLLDYFNADIIMCSGGTFLTENYNIQSCLYDFRLSVKTSAKLGFFPQTLGPFSNPINIKQLSGSLNKFDILMLRDSASRQHLIDIGVEESLIKIVPDAAFSVSKFIELPGKQNSLVKLGKVAISVRPLKFFTDNSEQEYIEGLVQLVEFLVREKNVDITFVSTCQGIAEYWSSDDKMADEIVKLLAEDVLSRVSVDREFRDPLSFAAHIIQYDLLIATRMHAAILAMSCGVPSIGIAYEFKIEELYRTLGLEDFYTNINSGIYDALINAVTLIDSKWGKDLINASRIEIIEKSLDALVYLPD